MPGFDGTGPRGMGPRTGGGRGFCPPMWPGVSPFRGWSTPPVARTPYPSYGAMATPGATPYAPQMTREDELGFLNGQAEMLKGQLEQIESRVRDLEAGS